MMSTLAQVGRARMRTLQGESSHKPCPRGGDYSMWIECIPQSHPLPGHRPEHLLVRGEHVAQV